MEPQVSSTNDVLDDFIEFLYGGLEGYAYVAAMPVGKPEQWGQLFLHYPTEVHRIKKAIQQNTSKGEVFLSPALFKEQQGGASRENFKAAQVVWADFDGNAPEWDNLIKHPSLVIQSSTEDRQHIYWRLLEPVTDVDQIEDYTRRVQVNYGADPSCWPAVHVLRPPLTRNHKRDTDVKLVHYDGITYDSEIFNNLTPVTSSNAEAPAWQLGELPDVADVLLNYAIPPDLKLLLHRSKEECKDRSAALMNAAHICCESGMRDVEVFVVLKMLDERWEKFSGRKDQDKQLTRIIQKARQKHPDVLPQPQDEDSGDPAANPLLIWDYSTFLEAELEVEWLIENMLLANGNMLMAGPSGVGKTQLSLQWMYHIALGKDFMGYKIPQPKKVGFLSLEMGHPDLQVFMRAQSKDLSPDEKMLLKENLEIIPWGEAWPLNKPLGQEQLMAIVEQQEWEGVFVDSIGSAILGNINSQEIVQDFTNFNDRIRKKFGIFLWYIHHTRKAAPGQQHNTSQDDVYGDQYLVNRCTSAYGVLPAKDGLVRVRNFKNRLAARQDDYLVERTPNLSFIKHEILVPEPDHKQAVLDMINGKAKADSDDPTAPGGFGL